MINNTNLANSVLSVFLEHFHYAPLLIRAPGRMNLIGEHTDYNLGFVLPAAISPSMYFAIGLNNRGVHRFRAFDRDESADIEAGDFSKNHKEWALYLVGALKQFHDAGRQISGVDCVFASDLPGGAGLSSSSALCCGFLLGLNTLAGTPYSRAALAMLGHVTEKDFVGLQGGIMDQHACLLGRKDHFLLIDCRSRDVTYVPADLQGWSIILLNTGVKHELTASDYNIRATECSRAVTLLQQKDPAINSLRDVDLHLLEKLGDMLTPTLLDRVEFVIRENQRVLEAVACLKNRDFSKLGTLLYASHEGLRTKYAVSCTELDFLVDEAQKHPGVAGARMMGGGFGGCTINLVRNSAKDTVVRQISAGYATRFGFFPDVHAVSPCGGATILE